jgi:hypothetical protein
LKKLKKQIKQKAEIARKRKLEEKETKEVAQNRKVIVGSSAKIS